MERDGEFMNNADYGLSLQKLICEKYNLEINQTAKGQFESNYNPEYINELTKLITNIFNLLGNKPIELLTYTEGLSNSKQPKCPHNFMLDSGKTLSIRTYGNSDKVAPRTLGQAGFPVLNEYFAEVYGSKIANKSDIKSLIINHIEEVLPMFIDSFFQSDYTVFVSKKDINSILVIKSDELTEYSFSKSDFTFTRGLFDWNESTTLKYKGKSIAEIQVHKERTFKFRFIISSIPEWFVSVKETNETLGISAEDAICTYFNLKKPSSFEQRVLKSYVDKLMPTVKSAFNDLPKAIKHSGSTPGDRGKQSKCSYDFILEREKTLSLKTNKAKMVCPPEVGQPGAETCYFYFGEYLSEGDTHINEISFKRMVLNKIDKLMPIYVKHLFDSDWLLWIYEEKGEYKYISISKNDIKTFVWEREKFTFTKNTLDEWNESNTVKYDGISIGEFQVHKNRNSYKFRFNMPNLLKLLIKQ